MKQAPKTFRRKVQAVAIGCVAGFLGLEIALRVVGATPGSGPAGQADFPSPFFTGFDPPMPIHVAGDLHYRNGTVPLVKEVDEVRIVCMGGSTTRNKRSENSYAELLEDHLNSHHRASRIRVLNAGSEGFSTAHTLVNFALRNLDAQPDVLFVYHNINDLSANWFHHPPTSDYSEKYLSSSYLDLRHRSDWLATLCKKSRVARMIAFRFSNGLITPSPARNDQPIDEVRTYFARNLTSLVALARAHDVRIVLATQAAKSDYRFDPHFSAFNQAVRDVATSQRVPLVDLAQVITDDDCFLEDSIHYTALGIEQIALALVHTMQAQVDGVLAAR